MKSQPVEVLASVEQDILTAVEYYSSWRADGASYFKTQFDDAVRWIEWNPELFPKRFRFFRRAVIRNTFFGIYYVIEPEVTPKRAQKGSGGPQSDGDASIRWGLAVFCHFLVTQSDGDWPCFVIFW